MNKLPSLKAILQHRKPHSGKQTVDHMRATLHVLSAQYGIPLQKGSVS